VKLQIALGRDLFASSGRKSALQRSFRELGRNFGEAPDFMLDLQL
jgi:hypothetical protein